MSTARLRARVPSCRPLCIASLPGRELRFHKRSRDGSGKCDAFEVDGGAGVIGVLFSFDAHDRVGLDRAEGRGAGYDAATVTVFGADGRRWDVLTYLAHTDHIDGRLRPYSWYRDIVREGAREHGLPRDYVADRIDAVEAVDDTDLARDSRERRVLGRGAA